MGLLDRITGYACNGCGWFLFTPTMAPFEGHHIEYIWLRIPGAPLKARPGSCHTDQPDYCPLAPERHPVEKPALGYYLAHGLAALPNSGH